MANLLETCTLEGQDVKFRDNLVHHTIIYSNHLPVLGALLCFYFQRASSRIMQSLFQVKFALESIGIHFSLLQIDIHFSLLQIGIHFSLLQPESSYFTVYLNLNVIKTYIRTCALCGISDQPVHSRTSRKHTYIILTPLNPTFI